MERNGSAKDQYCAKEAMKVNLKGRGANQLLTDMGPYLDGKTMFIGIDVTHPPGEKLIKEAPSIAGVVASTDGLHAQWSGSLRTQQGGQEIVAELEVMVMERLSLDGVSDGQYIKCLLQELSQVQRACEKIYLKKLKPKILFIVATKRIHLGIHPKDPKNGDKNGNPKAGTIVDTDMISDNKWDFFLVSHRAIPETAKPAKYTVIHDGVGIGVDGLEKLPFGPTIFAISLSALQHQCRYAHQRTTLISSLIALATFSGTPTILIPRTSASSTIGPTSHGTGKCITA
ncbi:hypothetical protein OEA41_005092 [Lepraria neglecta]|uniref:Piwi domain-containing protein n=1 Tax=Lepraria neglecta TaxID=209136 RepID=A0AAD9YYS6_9LECA|nr:hypothetical protein OEA41_005092 [Lepraria neglecta]